MKQENQLFSAIYAESLPAFPIASAWPTKQDIQFLHRRLWEFNPRTLSNPIISKLIKLLTTFGNNFLLEFYTEQNLQMSHKDYAYDDPDTPRKQFSLIFVDGTDANEDYANKLIDVMGYVIHQLKIQQSLTEESPDRTLFTDEEMAFLDEEASHIRLALSDSRISQSFFMHLGQDSDHSYYFQGKFAKVDKRNTTQDVLSMRVKPDGYWESENLVYLISTGDRFPNGNHALTAVCNKPQLFRRVLEAQLNHGYIDITAYHKPGDTAASKGQWYITDIQAVPPSNVDSPEEGFVLQST